MMKDDLKTIGKVLDSALEQYEQKFKTGDYESTSKDAEVLAHLVLAKLGMMGMCAFEKIGKMMGGEDGEKSEAKGFGMKPGSVKSPDLFSFIRGFMPEDTYNNMPMHHPQYPMNAYDTYNRKGVPGSGGGHRMGMDDTYDTYDMGGYQTPENRHRGRNGQWVKNHFDEDMEDYSPSNRQGGQTSPENKQGVPSSGSTGTGAGTQGR